MSFIAVLPKSQLILTDLIALLHFDISSDRFSVDTNRSHEISPSHRSNLQNFLLSSENSLLIYSDLFPLSTYIT